jgi:hypothetical protein
MIETKATRRDRGAVSAVSDGHVPATVGFQLVVPVVGSLGCVDHSSTRLRVCLECSRTAIVAIDAASNWPFRGRGPVQDNSQSAVLHWRDFGGIRVAGPA